METLKFLAASGYYRATLEHVLHALEAYEPERALTLAKEALETTDAGAEVVELSGNGRVYDFAAYNMLAATVQTEQLIKALKVG